MVLFVSKGMAFSLFRIVIFGSPRFFKAKLEIFLVRDMDARLDIGAI